MTQVSSGGQLLYSSARAGDPIIVLSGGAAYYTTVYSGGSLTNEGDASYTDILSGGVMTNDGTAYYTSVFSGGVMIDAGAADYVDVESGGVVSATSTASIGAVVSSGGTLSVASGVTLGLALSSGAHLVGSDYHLEYNVIVSSGVVISSAFVGGAGFAGAMDVISGGSIVDLTVVSGLLSLNVGAETLGIEVLSKATLELIGYTLEAGQGLLAGAISSSVIIGNTVLSSGAALDTYGETIMTGATETVRSKSGFSYGAMQTHLLDGARLNISANALAEFTVLSSGSSEAVYAQGLGYGEIIMSGAVEYGGAYSTLSSEVISAGGILLTSGIISGGTTVAGLLEIGSGGTDSGGTKVLSGGREAVLAGGLAKGVTVYAGGLETLSRGAKSQKIMLSGGSERVLSGAVDSSSIILGGGEERIWGAAKGATISSGGEMIIESGGLDNGATVSSGGVLVVGSGGTLSGAPLTLSGGAATISGTITSGTAVVFAGSGELVLANPGGFSGIISGMANSSQKLDLSNLAFDSAGETISWTEAANNTSGVLAIGNGAQTVQLTLAGNYVTSNFTLSDDGYRGTMVVDPPVVGFVHAMAAFDASRAAISPYSAAHSAGPGLTAVAAGFSTSAHG